MIVVVVVVVVVVVKPWFFCWWLGLILVRILAIGIERGVTTIELLLVLGVAVTHMSVKPTW